jgi:hypothetical protein
MFFAVCHSCQTCHESNELLFPFFAQMVNGKLMAVVSILNLAIVWSCKNDLETYKVQLQKVDVAINQMLELKKILEEIKREKKVLDQETKKTD